MDSALKLRISYDQQKVLLPGEITAALEQSEIVGRLTADYEEEPLFHIFRVLCLSEIPYTEYLPYTQQVISFISGHLAGPYGFSYTGKTDDIVPCYNAMLLEAYTRLGLADSPEAEQALNWIKKYQVFERNQKTAWEAKGICRHGGCMLATPCYIGIGKTVRALITYSEFTPKADSETEAFIDKGVEYMLRHHMYQRLSDRQPISRHITDVMFPQAYMLSLTDLVYIIAKRGLWSDCRTGELKRLIAEKAAGQNQWKLDYIYRHRGYKAFETKRYPSQWIGHIFNLPAI